MKFALEEERPSDSPFIEKVWYVRSEQAGDFISQAASNSEIVVARYGGQTSVTVRGPETKATPASVPAPGEFFGIVFKPGTFMPALLPRNLADRRDAYLPVAGPAGFWLDSSVWEIPDFENADTFADRLMRRGLLAHEPLVGDVLRGRLKDLSLRSVQRRFLRATGLTHRAMYQIERARQAAALLRQGLPILDVVDRVGYYDQPHMTRLLKHLMGQTPAQILDISKNE